MTTAAGSESKADAEALVPLFKLERILNQDQAGRRLTLLGTINQLPTLLMLERAAFPSDSTAIPALLERLISTTNLGANDIYRWYLSSLAPSTASSTNSPNSAVTTTAPDLKLNLIHPCTTKHISKYTRQRLRHVTETPEIYTRHIRPWISHQRKQGRLDWIFNILDGITEQEDVILRSNWDDSYFSSTSTTQLPSETQPPGFLLLPDLNWDRKTQTSLHLLALVQRRDIWSLRDLTTAHIPWLRTLRREVVKAAATAASALPGNGTGGEELVDEDELKCYVHYHPTYYHFHVHVVHVMLEAEGGTQNVGKAWELGGLIAMLEGMQQRQQMHGERGTHVSASDTASSAEDTADDTERGLDQVDFSYTVGEESELWKNLWMKIKNGEEVTLNG